MSVSNYASLIIKTVQENSITTGFQYCVDFSLVEEEFGIKLDPEIIENICSELSIREEVADVEIDDNTFDVVLYTDFAPNYIDDEEDG